jgi:tRNA(Ile2) C34 agmatinyltransferase TiaS
VNTPCPDCGGELEEVQFATFTCTRCKTELTADEVDVVAAEIEAERRAEERHNDEVSYYYRVGRFL